MKNCFLIVNFNDFKSTKHLVDNVKSYSCIDSILIVDNGSCDEERELLSSLQDKLVEVIYNDDNLGYSYGINVGAKYLIDKYEKCNLIISNSDVVILSEEDIVILLKELNKERVGIVGPQIMELGGISRGLKCVSPWVDLLYTTPIIKNLIPERIVYYNDTHFDCESSLVDIISSCFFLISSETLKKINFMDELVFLYYEDYILSKKIKNLGLLVKVVNTVKVKHLYSVTVDKVIKSVDKFKLFKNSQYYYHTTYNDANHFERNLLRLSRIIGIFIRNKK